jgi:catechol 2,3-dioxygenase-like lactoylglutathione lyase family enzyme
MTFEIGPIVPELWCSDFEKSMKFYTDLIGFKVDQRRGQDPHAYLSLNGAQIMIAHWTLDGSWEPWHPEPLEQPFGRGVNFQFMVDDAQHYHDKLLSKGIKLFRDFYTSEVWKTDCMDTRRQFMVLDPDGYLLRFSQSISTRSVTAADHESLNQHYGTSFP